LWYSFIMLYGVKTFFKITPKKKIRCIDSHWCFFLKIIETSMCDHEAACRQASRGGHYEHPETREPAVIKSTRRQARTRNISSLWNQSKEIPRPAQPHTSCINNTRIKPTVIIRTLCFLTDLRGSHVIKIWWDEHTIFWGSRTNLVASRPTKWVRYNIMA